MVHHRRMHPEAHGNQCPSCEKPFPSKSSRENHSKMHKIYVCQLCQKEFKPRALYNRHVRRRHGNLPKRHICDICQKRFLEGYELKNHLKLHSAVKERKCQKCEYQCNSITYMRRHEMKHDNRFNFECEECHQGFLAKNQLDAHRDRKHGQGGELYPCPTCSKTYSSKGL